jgi:putative peptidoglycan lipid II flippase
MIYELLVGGMLSAALVPVFSQVVEEEGRQALWALFSRVLSLAAVVLAALVLLLELLAPQVAWLLGGGFEPALQAALAQMIRIVAPGVRIRFSLDLSNPALRRILTLYLPIALGILISNVQIGIDRRLASSTGESSIAWMANATTMVQLPHGIVAVAISLAVLPTLSRLSAAGDQEGFRRTLAQGLRLVVVLIVPATLGLFVLAEPIIALLFEHGKFTSHDTFWTAWALRFYLVGLIFATVDWPLNYASYARQDTITPALVGVISVGVYLVVALALLQPMGMLGLVLADSAKHISHAIIMLIVTWRTTGGLAGLGLVRTTSRALLASAIMAVLMAVVSRGLMSVTTDGGARGLLGELALVGITAAVGALTYLGLAAAFRMEEVNLVRDVIRRRLRRPNLD